MAGQQFTRLKNSLPPGKWDDLDPILDELGITPKRILEAVLHIAETAERERDRLKAWDMLAKFSGIKPPERFVLSGNDFDIVLSKAADA